MTTHKNVDRSDSRAREAQRLTTLLDISQALSGTLNLKASLHRVLEILAAQYGAVRGLISLVGIRNRRQIEPVPAGESTTIPTPCLALTSSTPPSAAA